MSTCDKCGEHAQSFNLINIKTNKINGELIKWNLRVKLSDVILWM